MSSSASVPVDRSANDHIDHSNPFLGGSYGHQTRARVQPPWSDRDVQHSDREGGVSRLNLACGDAPHELFSSSKVQPEDSAGHMAHSQFTAYATTTTVEQNFEQKGTSPMFCDAAQEGSSTWMKPATNGKTYEKNLGEISLCQPAELSFICIAFSFAVFCFMFGLFCASPSTISIGDNCSTLRLVQLLCR